MKDICTRLFIKLKVVNIIFNILSDYKHGCAVVDLTSNAISDIQLEYKLPMTKDFGSHSMRLIMHWTGPVDYDMYGIFYDKD